MTEVVEGHYTCTVTKVGNVWKAEAWPTGFPDRVRFIGQADGPLKALRAMHLVKRERDER